MICQECGFDNPDRQLFCTRCGARIDVDYEDVEEIFSKEVQEVQASSTQSQIQQFLIFTVFLYLLALMVRNCVAINPPQPDVLPLLDSPIDVIPDKQEESIDPIWPIPIPEK